MMPLLRAVVLTLCLLAFATSVAADCAWVLWQNRVAVVGVNPISINSIAWKIDDSFPSVEECRRSRDAFRKIYPVPEVNEVGVQYSEYACLPDTVDTRGAKGK